VPNVDKAAFLFDCLELPTLSPTERGLLREIAHRVAMNTHHNWNPAQKDQVEQLFRKIAECFGLSLTL
jgi:hypothetical protein